MDAIRFLRNAPIRRKLIVIAVLACAVALLLAGVVLIAYEGTVFRSGMVSELTTTTAMIGDNSSAALTFNDPASAQQTLRSLAANQHVVGAAIYDLRGEVFATYDRAATERPARESPVGTSEGIPGGDERAGGAGGFKPPKPQLTDTHRFTSDRLEIFHRIMLAGEPAGTVYIESDLLEMRARSNRYVAIMALVFGLSSLAALLLATRLQETISRPVAHLMSVMRNVTAEQDYTVRARKESDDELGALMDGFNAMLTQIQAQASALQAAHASLEQRVAERTSELVKEIRERREAQAEIERIHRELMTASRQAGMAEIATNVLHNVGNVLNSVNVSAILVSDLAHKSKGSQLARVVELIRAHEKDLTGFVTADPRGKHLLPHLDNLAMQLSSEQATIVQEISALRANIEHIKDIVTMQQSYAKLAGVNEIVGAVDLVEDSLRMNAGALARHQVKVERDFHGMPLINCDKHKVLQILVNLVRNAKYACEESCEDDRRVRLHVSSEAGRVRIAVIDNGAGITTENMTRIFNHGFTTRATGHGFGLHSGALAARELGGSLSAHSDGSGHGATFTLELPLHVETAPEKEVANG